jgi:hypothetical protein
MEKDGREARHHQLYLQQQEHHHHQQHQHQQQQQQLQRQQQHRATEGDEGRGGWAEIVGDVESDRYRAQSELSQIDGEIRSLQESLYELAASSHSGQHGAHSELYLTDGKI